MLETLFGSKSAQKVLLYLENYEEGYALGISKTFSIPLAAVQNQLKKFELAGVVVSHLQGRTRVYTWNPRYVFLKPLRTLLAEGLRMTTEKETKLFYRERQRPRRAGKPGMTK